MATFRFSREEYISASMGLAKKQTLRFIFLLAALIFAITTLRVINNNNALAGIPYIIALVVMIITVFLVVRHRFGKLYDHLKHVKEEINADIDAQGVRLQQASGTVTLGWERISDWSENIRFLYLFDRERRAYILPKQALSPEEDQLLREHLASIPRSK